MRIRYLCIMHIIPCSLMLEVDFLGVSAKMLNRSFPQREAQHSFWNFHIPSRRCLASLSLPELLWRRRRAEPGNGKVRTMSEECYECQRIKSEQDSPAKHLGGWRGKIGQTNLFINLVWDYKISFSEMGPKHFAGESLRLITHLPHSEQRNCSDILGNVAGNICSGECRAHRFPRLFMVVMFPVFFMVHCQMERMDRAERGTRLS